MRFPKELTLKLPELQREALHEIHTREPDKTPTDLLEQTLAEGIMNKLAKYKDAQDVLAAPAHEESDVPDLAEDIELHLDPDVRSRLARAMKAHPRHTGEDFVLCLLDWGLSSYEESLVIADSTPVDHEGEDR